MTLLDIPSYFDVLVVGAGAAGLYTALCLPENLKIGLITKETISLSASDWAQGGIAAAVSGDDSPILHVEDTLRAGVGLCDIDAVNFLAGQAPSSIKALVNLGVAFDRHGDRLALTLEAAHSRNRVLHAADTTGREVITTLTAQVLRRSHIQIIQQALALDLWLDSQENCIRGISLFYQNQIRWIKARAVVLATGGGGQVFAQTTNPAVSTGDGVAIAWRCGAVLRDLEFMQFHPTALTQPGANRFLISEAVRGEGAHLIDDRGERFTFEYHPSGELAPRDIVSRAIFKHLQNTAPDLSNANVWLDMRPIEVDKIRQRFPNIIKVTQSCGIDVFSQPIPVAPAAHYWMGGILTDQQNKTSIPGLYAVGENASTGVHGANRLASNSLLECIVFGAQMENIELVDQTDDIEENSISNQEFKLSSQEWNSQQKTIEFIRQNIPRVVWKSAGICREESQMAEAITQIESWQRNFSTLPLTKFLSNLSPSQSVKVNFPGHEEKALQLWAETQNLLDIAYLLLKSAIFRTESRGGHYRLDFQQTDPKWQVHTMIQDQTWWKSSVIQRQEE
ncbi:MAG: L-aspartate oxidase [Cyanobacteria bacterium P01_A01_bin.45]